MSNEKKKVPTVTAGLDKRRKLADDFYNAALVIAFEYKRKYYHLTDGGGVKIKLKPKDLRSRETKELFDQAIGKAKKIIRSMPVFSFEKFESKYFTDQFDDSADLVKALRKYASSLPDSRLKTRIGYETVANIVEEYTAGKRLELHEVTPGWLKDFEEYLTAPYMKRTKTGTILKNGRNPTTVGIYLRNVRAVLLEWVRSEKPEGFEIPFGREKDGLYQIPSGQNIKKALDFEDVAKIYHFVLPYGSKVDFYRDLWLLSYLANGMNLKDICRLKYSNIDGENLTFYRSKTVGTRKGNQQKIIVPLTQEIASIIDKWKIPGGSNDFILPILKHEMTPRKELNKIQWTIKRINDAMRVIASELGINKEVNTYAARHTFATVAMRNGFEVAMISKALGHTSVQITEKYLGSFESQQIRNMAEKMSDFQKFKPK